MRTKSSTEDRLERPGYSLARVLARLTLWAASYPPLRPGFLTNPPIERFKHFGGARNTVMAGGISVAYVHNPRSDQKRNIDADRVIEGGSVQGRWEEVCGQER